MQVPGKKQGPLTLDDDEGSGGLNRPKAMEVAVEPEDKNVLVSDTKSDPIVNTHVHQMATRSVTGRLAKKPKRGLSPPASPQPPPKKQGLGVWLYMHSLNLILNHIFSV